MTRFDSNTGDFAAHFDYDPKVESHSILYLNKDQYYRRGYKATALWNNTDEIGMEIYS